MAKVRGDGCSEYDCNYSMFYFEIGETVHGASTRENGQTYETVNRDPQTENCHVREPVLTTETTASSR